MGELRINPGNCLTNTNFGLDHQQQRGEKMLYFELSWSPAGYVYHHLKRYRTDMTRKQRLMIGQLL